MGDDLDTGMVTGETCQRPFQDVVVKVIGNTHTDATLERFFKQGPGLAHFGERALGHRQQFLAVCIQRHAPGLPFEQ